MSTPGRPGLTRRLRRNIDSKSFVIIDELGRATSTRDGLAIALAMAEALIQSGAMVFFTTHFIEIGIALSVASLAEKE